MNIDVYFLYKKRFFFNIVNLIINMLIRLYIKLLILYYFCNNFWNWRNSVMLYIFNLYDCSKFKIYNFIIIINDDFIYNYFKF